MCDHLSFETCRKICERFTFHAAGRPFGLQLRAGPAIEADRVLVPIQDRPFEPAKLFLDTAPRDGVKHDHTQTFAAKTLAHIKIFDPDAVAPGETRKRIKPENEPGGRALVFGYFRKDAVDSRRTGLRSGPLRRPRLHATNARTRRVRSQRQQGSPASADVAGRSLIFGSGAIATPLCARSAVHAT